MLMINISIKIHVSHLKRFFIDFLIIKMTYTHSGPRSPVVLPPLWRGEVGCSTRGEGEACPGP